MEQPVNPASEVQQPARPARKPWAADRRERRLLPLSLLLAYLFVSFCLDRRGIRCQGFGVTALAAGWYGALFCYRGTGGMQRSVNRVLMGAVVLLALTFTIFSNQWFRLWNRWVLLLLIAVHTWELCGGTRLPWHRAGMLLERLLLLVCGPFVRCGAMADTVRSLKSRQGFSRWFPVLAGVGVTLPLLWGVTIVLMDADALFALVAGDAIAWLERHFGQVVLRLILAACGMPFLFSLLYFAAHTEAKPQEKKGMKELDVLPAVILLGALDTLYIFFLTVQGVALFGDQTYLQRAGISFAEYARSGFFQLVGLAGVNIALILAVIWLCRRDKRLQVLSTALVMLTGVLLLSAAWRMTLYVSAYGLSFKRLLTYWGMVILAVFLGLTVRKIWKKDFMFFRTAAPAALAWWLLLNYCNADALVSRYNVRQVEGGRLAYSAVEDLLYHRSGYDGLTILAEHLTDPDILPWVLEDAAADCESWTSWSVSAWRAAQP